MKQYASRIYIIYYIIKKLTLLKINLRNKSSISTKYIIQAYASTVTWWYRYWDWKLKVFVNMNRLTIVASWSIKVIAFIKIVWTETKIRNLIIKTRPVISTWLGFTVLWSCNKLQLYCSLFSVNFDTCVKNTY